MCAFRALASRATMSAMPVLFTYVTFWKLRRTAEGSVAQACEKAASSASSANELTSPLRSMIGRPSCRRTLAVNSWSGIAASFNVEHQLDRVMLTVTGLAHLVDHVFDEKEAPTTRR